MRFCLTFLLLILIGIVSFASFAQQPPRLMVGIVVDQMRPEYLYRFSEYWGKDGFNRFLQNGYVCANTNLNYAPSTTGPGHASIFSGTTPRFHGIAGNTWYDRTLKKSIYCASDSLVSDVGNPTQKKGSFSARNILTSNLSDELKINTMNKGKVVSMSLKDRAAAFPAGHLADVALWLDLYTGNFVSSTYYVENLPQWVTRFNDKHEPEKFNHQTWTPLLPHEAYRHCLPDDVSYEEKLIGKEKAAFPYHLEELSEKNSPRYESMFYSPFGNTLLADLAIEAINNADLGQDDIPDLLTVSFSAPDAIGHIYGPMSMEQCDNYIRLDRELARLFQQLDTKIGKDNYVVFLTADHGLAEPPAFLEQNNMPGGFIDLDSLKLDAASFLTQQLGEGNWIEDFRNMQFYFNDSLMTTRHINSDQAADLLAKHLQRVEGVAFVYRRNELLYNQMPDLIAQRIQLGFNPLRSGDVAVVLNAGITGKMTEAATHGTPYSADVQIPLLWYGKNIPQGQTYRTINVVDIATTAALMLHINKPASAIGQPIVEILH